MVEGSLEVKLPTIWTDEKQSRAEAERRKKMQMREKVEKSRFTVFRDFHSIFFLLTLSLSSNLSLFSASALLCFSSVHIVGSLTSKLPSTSISYLSKNNRTRGSRLRSSKTTILSTPWATKEADDTQLHQWFVISLSSG